MSCKKTKKRTPAPRLPLLRPIPRVSSRVRVARCRADAGQLQPQSHPSGQPRPDSRAWAGHHMTSTASTPASTLTHQNLCHKKQQEQTRAHRRSLPSLPIVRRLAAQCRQLLKGAAAADRLAGAERDSMQRAKSSTRRMSHS